MTNKEFISKQAAIDACLNGWNKDYKEIVEDIRALPSVTLAEKVGQWIYEGYYKCSECGKTTYSHKTNYCPNCGAKMQEVEEWPCENPHIYECSCGYGWDKSKVVRHHFCPNCGRKVLKSESEVD